jgi:hypothetical protein
MEGSQIETYQIPGGGATHGTYGPLAVSEGGFMTDLGEQFLQVARTLDPDHAQKPDDTDSNDLETINVYTVSVFRLNSQLDLFLNIELGAEVAQVRPYSPVYGVH